MSDTDHPHRPLSDGSASETAPVARPGPMRARAHGHDRPHQSPRRSRAVMVRLSETEHADVAAAAREAGLTPSGYAAEAALAAARGTDKPARQPLRVALAELVATRVEVTRLVRVLAATASGPHQPDGEPAQALGVLARVDWAAAAVVADLP